MKKIKLSRPEKEDIRGFLLTFMRDNPVRSSAIIRPIYQGRTFFPLFLTNKYMVAGLIAAILLAFGGGTAAAAENSLPGDLLYPVKVRVNEEVRAVLAVAPEAKAAWDGRRAERRLEEAEKLAAEGRLATSTSAMLAAKFDEQAEKMKARLQKLEDSGKLSPEKVSELNANFEASIKAHDEVISRMETREEEREELRAVRNSLKEQASSTIRARLRGEMEILAGNVSTTAKTAAENRKNAAVNKIAEVEKFISDNADKTVAEAKAEALKKLEEAKLKLAEGDKDFTDGKYGEAFAKFSEAHRKAQEAKLFLAVRFRLRVILNNVVSSALPVVSSTVREQLEGIKERREEARENLKDLEERIREEVKEAREKMMEFRKNEAEKIREAVKQRQEELKEQQKDEDEDDEVEVNVSVSGTAGVVL